MLQSSSTFVPVGEPIHQATAEGVKFVGNTLLRNAGTAVSLRAAGRIEGRNRYELAVTVTAESGALRPVVRIVDMYGVEREVGIVDVAKAANGELVFARWRQGRRIEVYRQQAVLVIWSNAVQMTNLFRCLVTGQHFCSVVSAKYRTLEGVPVEGVPGFAVVVDPDSPLRVIGE